MTERMRRVNEAIRETLAEAVGELKDPRIGFVTVTGVETSPDLRQARVYVSVLGNERKREKTLQGLDSAHGVLQAKLATESDYFSLGQAMSNERRSDVAMNEPVRHDEDS